MSKDQSSHLTTADDAERRWRPEYELKEVSADPPPPLSGSPQEEQKAQKQIRTVPADPTASPLRLLRTTARWPMQMGVFLL